MEGNKLTRYLSKAEVFALAFGCAVGWGVFIMPGSNFLPTGGPIGTLIGFIIGAIVMVIIGRNYHILMQRTNENGGAFSYAKNVFGKDHGFLVSWFLILIYLAILWANSSAFVLLIRYTFGNVLQFGFCYTVFGYDIYLGELLFSIIITTAICLLCAFKKKVASITQIIFSSILIVGVIFTFIYLLAVNNSNNEIFTPAFSDSSTPIVQIISIVALMPWAFVGFESISHSQSEMKFPIKKVFLLMTLAIVFGALCYILLVGVALVGTPDGYANWLEYIKDLPNLNGISAVPTFNAVSQKMGKFGIIILGITMSGALVTSVIANTTAASRILCTMSEEGILPKWFGKINKNGSPINAIYFIIITAIAIAFFGRTSIGWIADITTICATIAFLYTSLAAFKVSKKEHLINGMVTGIIGTIMSVVFFVSHIIPNFLKGATLSTESYFIFAAWGLLGLAYFRILIGTRAKNKPFGSSIVVWAVLLSMILITSLLWLYQNVYNAITNMENNIDNNVFSVMEDASLNEQAKIEAINNFSNVQSANCKNIIISTVVIVGVMMVIAIVLMLNIYSIAQKREEVAQIERIKAQEKSKAKSEFLFNMSHDIRTPMNAIVGFVELAKDPQINESQLKDYLSKIDISSKQLLTLINDILEMSRIENGKYIVEEDKVNILSLLDDIKTIFSVQMLEKKLTFNIVSENVNNPHLIVDKKGLNRILLNLIGNAYKFTPIGGEVTLKLIQGDIKENNKINHTIIVSDTGIGMNQEFIAKLFEPFERENDSTTTKIEGTGLGMAITKSIVEAMDGDIDVTSKKDVGTTFTVHLDFAVSSEKDELLEEVKFEENINLTGKRVLVVDDVEINREITALMAERLGLIPTTCEDGLVALNIVKEKDANYFDIILCDIQMPVMNGYTFTEEVRKLDDINKRHLPIIALTANAFEEDVKNALSHGMNGHIAKPISVESLESTIRKVLIERHQDE